MHPGHPVQSHLHIVKKKNFEDAATSFERALSQRNGEEAGKRYVLRLYVTGMTSRSVAAIENIKLICEEHLRGRYELEIIDVYQHPNLADDEQIVAAPALIKKLPLPLRRFIGDMSQTERILLGLDLRRKEEPSRAVQSVPQNPQP